jgi:hypothetical protein
MTTNFAVDCANGKPFAAGFPIRSLSTRGMARSRGKSDKLLRVQTARENARLPMKTEGPERNAMRAIKSLAMLFSLAVLELHVSGCTTATAIAGRDFDSSRIAQIQDGVTRTSEIRSCYGEPYRTVVVSATKVKWQYSWAQATAHRPFVLFGRQTVDTEGVQKELWLSIQDGVVVNHTYEEGPFERHTPAVPKGEAGALASE